MKLYKNNRMIDYHVTALARFRIYLGLSTITITTTTTITTISYKSKFFLLSFIRLYSSRTIFYTL